MCPASSGAVVIRKPPSAGLSSRWRRQLVQPKLAVLRGLLDLDEVALGIPAVDGLHVTRVDGTGLVERHAEPLQALVLFLDVRDVDAEVRVAPIERLERARRGRGRGAVLEELHVAA